MTIGKTATGEFLFQPGDTVVFAGDSITDAGRTEKRGRVDGRYLGEGYVQDIVGLIGARYPAHHIDAHNVGVSGTTSREMLAAWHDEVLARAPRWVTILIGINDCHLRIEGAERGVDAAEYYRNCREAVEMTRKNGAGVILIEPFYMWRPEDPHEERQRVLRELRGYQAATARIAVEFGIPHVRAHEAFARQLRHRPLSQLGEEPVHPNPVGHLVLAHEVLTTVNY
jgi:lysophospholipase L1-like esterase